MKISDYIDLSKKEIVLKIKATPNSSETKLLDVIAGVFKIRIKAIPEKGKANKELIKFLSKELNVEKQNISIISGESSNMKSVKISFFN